MESKPDQQAPLIGQAAPKSMIRKMRPALHAGWGTALPSAQTRSAFAPRSCSNKKTKRDDDSKKSHPALERDRHEMIERDQHDEQREAQAKAPADQLLLDRQ